MNVDNYEVGRVLSSAGGSVSIEPFATPTHVTVHAPTRGTSGGSVTAEPFDRVDRPPSPAGSVSVEPFAAVSTPCGGAMTTRGTPVGGSVTVDQMSQGGTSAVVPTGGSACVEPFSPPQRGGGMVQIVTSGGSACIEPFSPATAGGSACVEPPHVLRSSTPSLETGTQVMRSSSGIETQPRATRSASVQGSPVRLEPFPPSHHITAHGSSVTTEPSGSAVHTPPDPVQISMSLDYYLPLDPRGIRGTSVTVEPNGVASMPAAAIRSSSVTVDCQEHSHTPPVRGSSACVDVSSLHGQPAGQVRGSSVCIDVTYEQYNFVAASRGTSVCVDAYSHASAGTSSRRLSTAAYSCPPRPLRGVSPPSHLAAFSPAHAAARGAVILPEDDQGPVALLRSALAMHPPAKPVERKIVDVGPKQPVMATDTLGGLIAAGDVIFVRGSAGGIMDVGAVGGVMGHVMLVIDLPRSITCGSEEAHHLQPVWPSGVQTIWRVRTAESTRTRTGLHEADLLLYARPGTRRLALIGEQSDGQVEISGETGGEAVELWQSPMELRSRLTNEVVRDVLDDMKGNFASWSWATAARAVLRSPAAFNSKGRARLLAEIQACWESDPICTSVVIAFWQRALCKIAEDAGFPGVEPADLILEWMPLKADRSLPGTLLDTMRRCGWVKRVAIPATLPATAQNQPQQQQPQPAPTPSKPAHRAAPQQPAAVPLQLAQPHVAMARGRVASPLRQRIAPVPGHVIVAQPQPHPHAAAPPGAHHRAPPPRHHAAQHHHGLAHAAPRMIFVHGVPPPGEQAALVQLPH